MRFLTFNLWHGLSPSSTPLVFDALEPVTRRQLRERAQLQLLNQIAPDFAFFQEVNPVHQRQTLLSEALDSHCAVQLDLVGTKIFGLGIPFNLNSGLLISANKKWTFKKVDALSLSRPGFNLVHKWLSWQLSEERFALFAETTLPRWGRVLLVNTHLHHGLEATAQFTEDLDKLAKQLELPDTMVSELRERIMRGNERRVNEMSTLLKNIESLSQRYAAVILAGDFNSSPESPIAHQLREMGFCDCWSESGQSSSEGFTFDALKNHANHVLQADFPLTLTIEDLSFSSKVRDSLLALARKHEGRPRRIDYIWYRAKGLELKVKTVQLIGLPDKDGLAPSDHFGVCADIEAL